jgi:phage shock protein PspC (stress-responsive transcriptional regulator)
MMTSTSETPTVEHGSRSRLHRSARDRLISGVCGGIAEYLAVDASLVRLAFVVATLWGGVGLLLYVILAIILPVDEVASPATSSYASQRSHMLAGLVLVVLGGLLLAGNMGLAPWLSWNVFWPSVLILVGAGLLLRGPHSANGG